MISLTNVHTYVEAMICGSKSKYCHALANRIKAFKTKAKLS